MVSLLGRMRKTRWIHNVGTEVQWSGVVFSYSNTGIPHSYIHRLVNSNMITRVPSCAAVSADSPAT